MVAALRDLHAAYVAEFNRQPSASEAVFKKSEHEVYRHKDISNLLKLGADVVQMPGFPLPPFVVEAAASTSLQAPQVRS